MEISIMVELYSQIYTIYTVETAARLWQPSCNSVNHPPAHLVVVL